MLTSGFNYLISYGPLKDVLMTCICYCLATWQRLCISGEIFIDFPSKAGKSLTIYSLYTISAGQITVGEDMLMR